MKMDAVGIAALNAQVMRDLEYLSYPDKSWVDVKAAPDGQKALDCAIVGGGQFGLSVAFGLRREKVDNVRVFDANPEGFEGPWLTFARMSMLRTPKDLTGPDLGIGSLTFRAWYEAQHGIEGWNSLDRIPREHWMGYLRWYRDILKIDVQNQSELIHLEPIAEDLFCLTFRHLGKPEKVYARTVVLSTGAEGSGARFVSPLISDNVPKHLYAHTNDAVDVARFKGKRIGILGAGASAFDYASSALEAGATEARIFFRRQKLPLQNPRRWMEFSAFLAHYPELDDEMRWSYMKHLYDISQPPPVPTFERAVALPGFFMHPGSPWQSVSSTNGDTVSVRTESGESFEFDFVFSATGMIVDMSLRPELAAIEPLIALWKDRYEPPVSLADDRLGRFPYLGRYCDFQERHEGSARWLSRIFTITRGATMSMGPSAASNSNLKYTAPRIIAGVTRTLFLDQSKRFFHTFKTKEHNELAPERVASVA